MLPASKVASNNGWVIGVRIFGITSPFYCVPYPPDIAQKGPPPAQETLGTPPGRRLFPVFDPRRHQPRDAPATDFAGNQPAAPTASRSRWSGSLTPPPATGTAPHSAAPPTVAPAAPAPNRRTISAS